MPVHTKKKKTHVNTYSSFVRESLKWKQLKYPSKGERETNWAHETQRSTTQRQEQSTGKCTKHRGQSGKAAPQHGEVRSQSWRTRAKGGRSLVTKECMRELLGVETLFHFLTLVGVHTVQICQNSQKYKPTKSKFY
jgi:hypothetical protein